MRSLHFFSLAVVIFAAARLIAQEKPSDVGGNLLAAKAFHVAAENVLSSVVTIETYGGVSTGARRGRIAGLSKPGNGPTTGLIISKDGHILTSTFNFRDKPPIITVILRDGTKHVAELLGRDNTRQICVLKIATDSDLPVSEFLRDDELRVGQWAVSVGVGYGDFEPAISAGILSALQRIQGRAVQTDANISPANYGGPLVAIDGRVIGICVSLHPGAAGDVAGVEWYDSGIGFAIPLSGLEEPIAKMKAGENLEPESPRAKSDE